MDAWRPGSSAWKGRVRQSVWLAGRHQERSRFFDPGMTPTPEITGLPLGANKRNREWHFTNVPFTMDNTPTMPPAATNVLTKLKELESLGALPTQMQVFLLPWLIHLVGDVHQPLHTLALFRSDLPQGD